MALIKTNKYQSQCDLTYIIDVYQLGKKSRQ